MYLLRFLYLLLFTGHFVFTKKKYKIESVLQQVSLLLTVRNESENLKNNLPKILELQNPGFEVVVVDDFSQDETFSVLGVLQEKYKNLKVSSLNQETRHSVKMAQNIALKAAVNDWVLVVPVSFSNVNNDWLDQITQQLVDDLEVVVGYTTIESTGRLFNRLFRIENFFLHLKSVGLIANNIPFIYAEENVVFKKKLYFEQGGFGHNIKEPFANLELVINAFVRKGNTRILFDKETTIRKKEQIQRADYFGLIKKSYRIESRLPGYKRLCLALEEWSRLIYLPLSITVITLLTELWPIILLLLGIKFIVHVVIIKIGLIRLNEDKIFIPSLVYDLIAPYFKLIYRWQFTGRSSKQKWRSRT